MKQKPPWKCRVPELWWDSSDHKPWIAYPDGHAELPMLGQRSDESTYVMYWQRMSVWIEGHWSDVFRWNDRYEFIAELK